MADATIGPVGWERALMAAEKVKERLRRATKALDDAGVPYAVAGGNAVAEWVARVDEDELARPGLARHLALAVAEHALGHDEGQGDGVPVLGDPLAGRQPEANHPHGPAVGDLLPSERPVLHRRRIMRGGGPAAPGPGPEARSGWIE